MRRRRREAVFEEYTALQEQLNHARRAESLASGEVDALENRAKQLGAERIEAYAAKARQDARAAQWVAEVEEAIAGLPLERERAEAEREGATRARRELEERVTVFPAHNIAAFTAAAEESTQEAMRTRSTAQAAWQDAEEADLKARQAWGAITRAVRVTRKADVRELGPSPLVEHRHGVEQALSSPPPRADLTDPWGKALNLERAAA